MTSFTKSSRSILLWGVLLLSGCGYRAPLHQSYIPQVKDTTLYDGVRSDYQQLAALMEKDTELKPTRGNTVTMIKDGAENWEMLKEEFRAVKKTAYIEPYRFRLDTCGSVLADILREKIREGVDVRIILDKSANLIGSANLDNLSLFLNYEMVAVIYDDRICKRYEETFLSDIKNNCVEVEEAQVKKWSVFRRIRNWMIRVLGGPLG